MSRGPDSPEHGLSILATTLMQFDGVAGRLDPEPQITQHLRHPRRPLTVSVPIRTDADHPLRNRGIFIIPDVLANAAAVIVSYFEWVQDLQFFFWKEDEVNSRLRDILV